MKKGLVDTMLSSEKRRKVLLILNDGPKSVGELVELLGTTRNALLPQIKILIENHLIYKNENSCELTTVGKLLVEEMERFLLAISAFDKNRDFLESHKIDFIPIDLLRKLKWLGQSEIVEVPLADFFDDDKEFYEKAVKSNYWLQITSTIHPSFHNFYAEMTNHIIEVSIIISEQVFEKIRKDYYYELKDLIDLDLISFYLFPGELEFQSFTFADNCINFRLLTKEGNIDNKKMIYCSNQAEEWGKAFFDYYKQISTPIIDI
jgi:predicted transcriptional regulator